jgi:hypothetical protein
MADDAATSKRSEANRSEPRSATINGPAEPSDVDVDSMMAGDAPARASRRVRLAPPDAQGKDVSAGPAAGEGGIAEDADNDHAEGEDPGYPRGPHTKEQRNSMIDAIAITDLAVSAAPLGCAPPVNADAVAYLINGAVRSDDNFAITRLPRTPSAVANQWTVTTLGGSGDGADLTFSQECASA